MWVQVVGSQMYHWSDSYADGPKSGAPGRGGSLWEGKHGFCGERWKLWKVRFGDIAAASEVPDGVRRAAKQGEERMKVIEAEAELSFTTAC